MPLFDSRRSGSHSKCLTKAELESLLVDPVLYEDIQLFAINVAARCEFQLNILLGIPVYMLSPTPSPPPEEESSHSFWKFSDVFGKSEVKENIETTPKLSRQKKQLKMGVQKRNLRFDIQNQYM
ncbi:spire-like protein 1 [Trichonephila clavata]|uniref:Spire-like protein 1 n=1 Tax=Trichonephila clavata TaxID=2740835 RepID=A0A8X6K1W9_TRICU|nr:spire-like protein 1 [Trichonephila clavata]